MIDAFERLIAEGPVELRVGSGTFVSDGLSFRTCPIYTGNPWFLAPSILYDRWRDSRGA